jgi:hypothetical protein
MTTRELADGRSLRHAAASELVAYSTWKLSARASSSSDGIVMLTSLLPFTVGWPVDCSSRWEQSNAEDALDKVSRWLTEIIFSAA